jgi:hypothetical protein
VVIEDLVKFGEDRGFEKGALKAERSMLRRVLELRHIVLGPEAEARIAACTDPATLQRWFDHAVLAASAAEVFQ